MLEFIVFLLGFGAGAAGTWFILGGSDADTEQPTENTAPDTTTQPTSERRPGAAALAGQRSSNLSQATPRRKRGVSAAQRKQPSAGTGVSQKQSPSASSGPSDASAVSSSPAAEADAASAGANGPMNVRPAPKRAAPKKKKGASVKGKADRKKKIAEQLDGKGEAGMIDGDEVGGALNVSGATAKRYLKELESEGAIEQVKEGGKAKYRRPQQPKTDEAGTPNTSEQVAEMSSGASASEDAGTDANIIRP